MTDRSHPLRVKRLRGSRAGKAPRRWVLLALAVTLGLAGSFVLFDHPSSNFVPKTVFGEWIVSTSETYQDTSITVQGNVTIQGGGSLNLIRVSLSLVEPTDLLRSIRVLAGGSFSVTGGSISSATSGNHYWVEAQAGSRLSLNGVSVTGIGGPATNEGGLVSQADGLTIQNSTFSDYYTAIDVNRGQNIFLANNSFLTSRGPYNKYAVSVAGASGVAIQDNLFLPQTDTGALLIVSPNNLVARNRFYLPPNGNASQPVLFAYAGTGSPRADNSTILDNTIEGAGLNLFGISNVVVQGNHINNSGPRKAFGIVAGVPTGSMPDLWMHDIAIRENVVTNFTRYGIRLERNVTRAQVHGNVVMHPTGTQGEAYGIYLIRAINNVTVSDNYLDMYVAGNIPTVGVSLESRVNDVTVEDNRIYDASQKAVIVQGDEGVIDRAPYYYIGPSLRNRVLNNTMALRVPVLQAVRLTSAIATWLWANYTIIENNTVLNYSFANNAYAYNGAAILTSSSLQSIVGNRIVNARYGFVFHQVSNTHEVPQYGSFNRSANVVAGNVLVNISKTVVVEDESDNLGPIHNVILVTSEDACGAFPYFYYEAMTPIPSLNWTTSSTEFTLVMQAPVPISGRVETLTATASYMGPALRWSVTGVLDWSGSRYGNAGIDEFPPENWTYRIPTDGPTFHTLSVARADANYMVSVWNGTTWSNQSAASDSHGMLSFPVGQSGALLVHIPWSGNATPTSAPKNVVLTGHIVTSTGKPLAGVAVNVTVLSNGIVLLRTQVVTDSTGAFSLILPPGIIYINLSLAGYRYYGGPTVLILDQGCDDVVILMEAISTPGGGPGGMGFLMLVTIGIVLGGAAISLAVLLLRRRKKLRSERLREPSREPPSRLPP